MMVKTIDLQGRIYDIVPCTKDDVLLHAEMVHDLISDAERNTYIERMRECVDVGTAYKISDDSAFLYYMNYEKCLAWGCAFYGRGAPHQTIALVMGIFHKIDRNTFSIKFKGHDRPNFLQDFRSLCTPTSIKHNRANPDSNETPFVVRIDQLKKKWGAVAKRRGLSWEV